MASKSAQANEHSNEAIEELLDTVDKALDRVKVLYEQYFLGIQKQPPTHLHTDAERKLRDLAHIQIRNTALRYRFAMIQQKMGSYNSYWRRTLRQIENGTYTRNLQKIGRQAARTGADIPEEILAAMPKRMRDQVLRDREAALAIARRRGTGNLELTDEELALDENDLVDLDEIAPAPRPAEKKTATGAHILSDADADFDMDAFFADVQSGTIPPPMQSVATRLGTTAIPTIKDVPPSLAGTATPSRPFVPPLSTPSARGPSTPPSHATTLPMPTIGERPGAQTPVSGVPAGARPATPPVGVPVHPPTPPAGVPRPPTPAGGVPVRAATPPTGVPVPRPPTPAGGVPARAATPPTGVPVRPATPPTGVPVMTQPMPTVGERKPPIVQTQPMPAATERPRMPTPPVGIPSIPRPTSPTATPTPRAGVPASTTTIPHSTSVPSIPSIPRPGSPSTAPSQVTRPNPIAPGSAARVAPVAVETMAGPFPRETSEPAKPTQTTRVMRPVEKPEPPPRTVAAAPLKPPPGMSDADVDTLYKKYIQAKQSVGEQTGPGAYNKLLKTINQQAPKIMEQYKAKSVDFTVVVKDNQVIIRAKPKS